MNSLILLFSSFVLATILLFQGTAADEEVPYTPQEGGPGWLLVGAAVLVLVALVFVLLKVFRGMQRSRKSEVAQEKTDSPRTPEK